MINNSFNLLGISLAPAIAVTVLVISAGHISGTHLNPAVSFAFLIAKKSSGRDFLAYTFAQFLGAGLASLALRKIYTEEVASTFRNGITSLASGTSYFSGFAIEATLTFLLVFVIFTVTQKENSNILLAPIAIGSTIAINIMTMGTTTGASFNPVRWFGPALAGGYWENASLYLLAPFVGAGVAVLFFSYLSSGTGRSPE